MRSAPLRFDHRVEHDSPRDEIHFHGAAAEAQPFCRCGRDSLRTQLVGACHGGLGPQALQQDSSRALLLARLLSLRATVCERGLGRNGSSLGQQHCSLSYAWPVSQITHPDIEPAALSIPDTIAICTHHEAQRTAAATERSPVVVQQRAANSETHRVTTMPTPPIERTERLYSEPSWRRMFRVYSHSAPAA